MLSKEKEPRALCLPLELDDHAPQPRLGYKRKDWRTRRLVIGELARGLGALAAIQAQGNKIPSQIDAIVVPRVDDRLPAARRHLIGCIRPAYELYQLI